MSEEFECYRFLTVEKLKETLREKFASGLEIIDVTNSMEDIANDLDHEVTHIDELYKHFSEKVFAVTNQKPIKFNKTRRKK